jgi:hypothetical protein
MCTQVVSYPGRFKLTPQRLQHYRFIYSYADMETISPISLKDLKMRPMCTALEAGRGILAIYTLIYPSNYPLTGRFLDLMGTFAHDRSLYSIGTR